MHREINEDEERDELESVERGCWVVGPDICENGRGDKVDRVGNKVGSHEISISYFVYRMTYGVYRITYTVCRMRG